MTRTIANVQAVDRSIVRSAASAATHIAVTHLAPQFAKSAQSAHSAHSEYVLSESEAILSKTDLNGNFTYVNRDCLRISGYSEAELLGKHQSIMRHPDMPKEVGEDLWRTLKQGKTWSGIMKNRSKSGGFYWVEANAAPILEQGRITGYVTIRIKPTRGQIAAADAAYRAINGGSKDFYMRGGKAVVRSWTERANLWAKLTVKAKLMVSFGVVGLTSIANAASAWF